MFQPLTRSGWPTRCVQPCAVQLGDPLQSRETLQPTAWPRLEFRIWATPRGDRMPGMEGMETSNALS